MVLVCKLLIREVYLESRKSPRLKDQVIETQTGDSRRLAYKQWHLGPIGITPMIYAFLTRLLILVLAYRQKISISRKGIKKEKRAEENKWGMSVGQRRIKGKEGER